LQLRQLQHVILEIGRRFDLRDFYVVGSAAILAALPDPPAGSLTATRDVDVIPPGDDEQLADRISFMLGEASDFDIEHGYYAQGVSLRAPAFAPSDWQARTLSVSVAEYTAWCMEPHDLVLSKRRDELLARLESVTCTDDHRRQITARVNALFR
jgi:hypothetical protein